MTALSTLFGSSKIDKRRKNWQRHVARERRASGRYMENKSLPALVPYERVETKILLIRGKKVMLDRDLAMLYGVSTGVLNQAVRRDATRFPDDFMFELSSTERRILISQFVISSIGEGKLEVTNRDFQFETKRRGRTAREW